MPHLVFRQPQAPTEHSMGGDSVEAVVDDGRGQVRQFRVLRGQCRRPAIHCAGQCGKSSSGIGTIGHRPINIDELPTRLRDRLQKGFGIRRDRGIVFVQDGDASHNIILIALQYF